MLKKTIIIVLAYCSMLKLPIASTQFFSEASPSDVKKEIELMGSLSSSVLKSGSSAVKAWIETYQLRISFLKDLDNIDILIHSCSGQIVYEQSVNTSIKDNVAINLVTWEGGIYEICFVNNSGNIMYGEFEIKSHN